MMSEQGQSRIEKFHVFDIEIISIKNEYKLLKFKVKTKNKYINELVVNVSKINFDIHFDNSTEVVSLYIQNNIHSYAVKNCFDFYIYDEYHSLEPISPGKLNQYVACGISDRVIAKSFPDFNNDPTCYYLNMSRIDFLEIIGLSQESGITLECYRLQLPREVEVDLLSPPVC